MKRLFPRYLSAPLQILFWDTDELCLIKISFTIAMIFGSWSYLLVIVVPWGYGRVKKRYPRGFIRHVFYFAGILKIHNYPDFSEELFLE